MTEGKGLGTSSFGSRNGHPFLLLPDDGLLLVNASGRVIHLDRKARLRLGAEATDLKGAVLESVWPELAHQIHDRSAAIAAAGPADFVLSKGGEQRRIRLFRSEDGVGIGLLAEKSVVEESGPRLQLLEGMLASLRDAVLLTTAEPFAAPGPIILYVNDAVLRQTGYERGQVLGRSPRLFQGPDTDPAVRARIRRNLSQWQPFSEELLNYTKEGRRFWVELEISPLIDSSGWCTHWVSVQRDVSIRRQREQTLAEREEEYRLLAENSSDVVIRWDEAGVILWASPSLRSTLGWEPHEWVGRPYTDFLPRHRKVDGGSTNRPWEQEGGSCVRRDRALANDGSWHWVEAHTSRYREANGRINGAVASFRLMDKEVAAEQELERRARFDDLTGLLNRQEMLDLLQVIKGKSRRSGTSMAVLFCDLDRFKDINDTYGHAAGDEVLRVLAQRLRRCLRSEDLTARIGGDELLVLLNGVQDLANAVVIAEKIRGWVSEPIPTTAGPVRLTLSIGVTMVQPGEEIDALIARADAAMYQGKQTGRNRVIPIPVAAP